MTISFRSHLLFAFSLMLSAFFISCQHDEEKSIRQKNSNEIILKGSESELKLIGFLTDTYEKEHPGMKMNLSGGGSAIGIKALINGETDIANCSRMFSSGEIKEANAKNVNPASVIIAMDAVVIITNPKVGIDSLSLNQLSDLFSGRIKNWKEVGGADLPVVIFSRNENSGTYHYILDHLRLNGFPTGTIVKAGNVEIVDAVSKQAGALGYVNLGSVYDDQEKPCKTVWVANVYVEGGLAHSPYEVEYVKNGEYPLTRPLYQYVNQPASESEMDFIRFELSDKIQMQLQSHGYFPITAIHKTINSKNGF